jgi:hypothetical protein
VHDWLADQIKSNQIEEEEEEEEGDGTNVWPMQDAAACKAAGFSKNGG